MIRLPALRPAEFVRAMKKAGFEEVRQTGSHLSMFNKHLGKMIIVPMHNKDLKRGLMLSLIKDAGMTKEEFQALL